MKKIVVLLLSIWIVQPCYSQMNSRFDMFAIFMGFGPTIIVGNPSWTMALGAMTGIEARIVDISEVSTLSVGIGITCQGSNYEDDYNPNDPYYGFTQKSAQYLESSYKGKVSLGYIVVPLLYNYKFNGGFYGEIGLQPGILISAKDKYNGSDSYDYKDFVKGFDLGIPVGAGYQINESFSIGARATFGITNLDDAGSEKSDHNVFVVALLRYKIGALINR